LGVLQRTYTAALYIFEGILTKIVVEQFWGMISWLVVSTHLKNISQNGKNI